MKKTIKKLCIWWLTKYYPLAMHDITIKDRELKFKTTGFMKNDKDWHHYAYSVDFWLKNETGKQLDFLVNSFDVYSDGELARTWQLNTKNVLAKKPIN